MGVKRRISTELVPMTIVPYSVSGAGSSGTQYSETTPAEAERHGIPPPPKKKVTTTGPNLLDEAETDATRNLSTAQLSRLVLLEQLKLLKMKQERMHAQVQVIPTFFTNDLE